MFLTKISFVEYQYMQRFEAHAQFDHNFISNGKKSEECTQNLNISYPNYLIRICSATFIKIISIAHACVRGCEWMKKRNPSAAVPEYFKLFKYIP